jgi:hypothetical protein
VHALKLVCDPEHWPLLFKLGAVRMDWITKQMSVLPLANCVASTKLTEATGLPLVAIAFIPWLDWANKETGKTESQHEKTAKVPYSTQLSANLFLVSISSSFPLAPSCTQLLSDSSLFL